MAYMQPFQPTAEMLFEQYHEWIRELAPKVKLHLEGQGEISKIVQPAAVKMARCWSFTTIVTKSWSSGSAISNFYRGY